MKKSNKRNSLRRVVPGMKEEYIFTDPSLINIANDSMPFGSNIQPCMSQGYESQEKRAEYANRIQRARNQNHKEESIDYGSLSSLLDKVIVEAIRAKSECSKEHPDEVEICDHAVENLGRLYDQIESCVLSHDLRSMQVNNGIVEINVNFR